MGRGGAEHGRLAADESAAVVRRRAVVRDWVSDWVSNGRRGVVREGRPTTRARAVRRGARDARSAAGAADLRDRVRWVDGPEVLVLRRSAGEAARGAVAAVCSRRWEMWAGGARSVVGGHFGWLLGLGLSERTEEDLLVIE